MHKVLTNIKGYIKSKAKPIRDISAFIGFVFALILIFALIVNASIIANTEDRIYTADEITELNDKYDCILILGAGVRADGTPSSMLEDRLITGLSCYESGISKLVFISGDSDTASYTETVVMRNYLLKNGLSESDMLEDGWGLSTYESLWRAKNVYGFRKVLIITQKYHLHRALYIADSLGIKAVGVDSALRPYRRQPEYNVRETLARVKDMIFSELRPIATYTEKWGNTYE